jgi:hypothetical protein
MAPRRDLSCGGGELADRDIADFSPWSGDCVNICAPAATVALSSRGNLPCPRRATNQKT